LEDAGEERDKMNFKRILQTAVAGTLGALALSSTGCGNPVQNKSPESLSPEAYQTEIVKFGNFGGYRDAYAVRFGKRDDAVLIRGSDSHVLYTTPLLRTNKWLTRGPGVYYVDNDTKDMAPKMHEATVELLNAVSILKKYDQITK
jgi:hypothetical protein